MILSKTDNPGGACEPLRPTRGHSFLGVYLDGGLLAFDLAIALFALAYAAFARADRRSPALSGHCTYSSPSDSTNPDLLPDSFTSASKRLDFM